MVLVVVMTALGIASHSVPGLAIAGLMAIGELAVVFVPSALHRHRERPALRSSTDSPSYSAPTKAGRLIGMSATQERSDEVASWKSTGYAGIQVVEYLARSRSDITVVANYGMPDRAGRTDGKVRRLSA